MREAFIELIESTCWEEICLRENSFLMAAIATHSHIESIDLVVIEEMMNVMEELQVLSKSSLFPGVRNLILGSDSDDTEMANFVSKLKGSRLQHIEWNVGTYHESLDDDDREGYPLNFRQMIEHLTLHYDLSGLESFTYSIECNAGCGNSRN